MPIIPSQDRLKIEEILQNEMVGDVEVTVLTQPPSKLLVPEQPQGSHGETEELLRELADLSPKIRLEVVDAAQQPERLQEYGLDMLPAIVLHKDGWRNLRFFGFPGGYGFSNLLQDLILLSRQESGLPKELEDEVSGLEQPVHIQVLVTPT